jgi:hypothetical protein
MTAARMVPGWRPAAGAAGGGVFAEGHVADVVVVCLDGPVLADEAGQVLRGGVGAGQAGDGVDGLAGDLAGGGVLPPAGDLDGLAGAGEVQVADVGGLQGAGLGAAVPGLAGGDAGRYLPQGRALIWACRIVFSSGTGLAGGDRVPRGAQPARSAWLARLIHWPAAVNRSFPAAVNAQVAIATRQASG